MLTGSSQAHRDLLFNSKLRPRCCWARRGPLLRRRGGLWGFLLLKPKLLKLRKFLARRSGASNKRFITGCKRSQLRGPELELPARAQPSTHLLEGTQLSANIT